MMMWNIIASGEKRCIRLISTHLFKLTCTKHFLTSALSADDRTTNVPPRLTWWGRLPASPAMRLSDGPQARGTLLGSKWLV